MIHFYLFLLEILSYFLMVPFFFFFFEGKCLYLKNLKRVYSRNDSKKKIVNFSKLGQGRESAGFTYCLNSNTSLQLDPPLWVLKRKGEFYMSSLPLPPSPQANEW